MGELVRFDPAEIAKKAKDYKIDLPPECAANLYGPAALIATSVITRNLPTCEAVAAAVDRGGRVVPESDEAGRAPRLPRSAEASRR